MCLACEMDGEMDRLWFAAMEARAHAAAEVVPPATLIPPPEEAGGGLPDVRAAPRFACEETPAE
jgi:hypothetical protein